MKRIDKLYERVFVEAQQKFFVVKYNLYEDPSAYKKVKVAAIDDRDAKDKVLRQIKGSQNPTIAKESLQLKFDEPQVPEIVRKLAAQPLYYHACDEAYSEGQTIPAGKWLSYSLQYAKSRNKKYLYAVTTPDKFKYATTGNKWAQQHIMNFSPIKVKRVL